MKKRNHCLNDNDNVKNIRKKKSVWIEKPIWGICCKYKKRSAGNRRQTAHRVNIRRREVERKRIDRRRNESPKRASIPVEGRMTFGKLRASRGRKIPLGEIDISP